MGKLRLESRERLEDARGQGEAAWVEEAGVEGKAAGVEKAGPGRCCQVGGWPGKDGEVELVRWRWQGVRNHRIMWEAQNECPSLPIKPATPWGVTRTPVLEYFQECF